MCDISYFIESCFCCVDHKPPRQPRHKKTKHHSEPQPIYHRISMLLPQEEFSFHKACEHFFPQSEVHIHSTEHAILPIVINKDGHLFQDKKARKI